ncbi:MAG: penicillin-binding protein activator [Thermodesulfobacteriota bacterium]|nr:penicillin-binding protein activator [Thermodesulfobacteriota bacterium]
MLKLLPLLLLVLSIHLTPDVGCAAQIMATAQNSLSLNPAKMLYEAGDNNGALSTLRRYILNYPDSPHLFEAHTLMARILLDESRDDAALFYLERIPKQQRSATDYLLLAVVMQHCAQMLEADAALSAIGADIFSGKDLALFYRTQANSLLFQQQPLQALVVLRTALQHSIPSDQGQLFKQVQQVLQQLTADEVAEAAFMFAATELNDALALYRAQQALSGGDTDLARQIVEPLLGSVQTAAVKIDVAALLDRIYGHRWYQRAIGVVLPLSGRYAPYGELVRQGIELAVAQQVDNPVRFIFLDSQADVEQTELAVRALVDGDRVMAVIGPLMGNTAQCAVPIADTAHVPLLTLSYRPGLPSQGKYIFRNSLTVKQQAEALADYAIEVLSLNTYAILSPDNRVGAEFAEQFSVAIDKLGGDVLQRRSFAEQATDFRRQLLLLKGDDPNLSSEQLKKLAVEKEAQAAAEAAETAELLGEDAVPELKERPDWLPTVDFEALFIPASAEHIALIAPQLVYYGIENVQLFGINGWNSSTLIQQAGRYTQGAIFSDGFYVNSQDAQVVAFVNAYQQRFSDKPSILAAQGYDSAQMLLAMLSKPEIVSPQMLQQVLLDIDNYRGVTGIQGFDDFGEAQSKLFLIKMGRRALHQLQWETVGNQPERQDIMPTYE